MTIEATLERIAVALETLVARSAPVAEPAGEQPAPEAPKPKRGRPAKQIEAPAETAPPAENDDFLKDEPASTEKEVTKENVVAALTAYAGRPGVGMAKARELMKKAGGSDSIGKVPPEKYADVVKAIPAA